MVETHSVVEIEITHIMIMRNALLGMSLPGCAGIFPAVLVQMQGSINGSLVQ
jgi:hypothetical protein